MPSNLVPFDPDKHTAQDVGFGSPSTEVTITVDMPDGTIGVIPSVWWDKEGKPKLVGNEAEAIQLAQQYEKNNKKQFPRFGEVGNPSNYRIADVWAQGRSASGGATLGELAQDLETDTSWVTDDMLNALAMTESDMNPKAYNETSGAAGMYQWMPKFYKEGADIGFGVDSGAFDPYDETESRKRTKQYLKGIQRKYPDWSPEDVLRAYNWGHTNVRDLKSGDLNLEEYRKKDKWSNQKADEAMNYPNKIFKNLEKRSWENVVSPEELEGTDPFPSTIDPLTINISY